MRLSLGIGLGITAQGAAIVDPELVQNGTFDTDTTGWASGSSAGLSVVGGRLRVTNIASYGFATQTVTVESGKTYAYSIDRWKGTSTASGIRLGSTPAGIEYFSISSGTDETNSGQLVTTNTTLYITLYDFEAATGSYTEFDNVSIQEVV